MKNLKRIRVLVSVICFAAAVLYVVCIRFQSNPVIAMEEKAQIVPSRIILLITLSACLFWLAVTIMLGRIYCSSVCPLGALQDGVIALCRKLHIGRNTFRYKKRNFLQPHFLIIYAVCLAFSLAFSLGIVGAVMEPWPIFNFIGNLFHPEYNTLWNELGYGLIGGILAGVISLVGVVVWSALNGRDFCNVFCPVGTLLGLVADKSLFQIRIDPDKCISCLKCEDVCKASCISVEKRLVDNARCVRCFNCLDVCPNKAIRYQKDQNKAATPLINKAN